MFVKVLREFLNKNNIAKAGNVIEVTPQRATELEKKGLVVPTVGGKSGASDPFPSRQLGGQTGAEKPAPSLQVALLPKMQTLKIGGRKGKGKTKGSSSSSR